MSELELSILALVLFQFVFMVLLYKAWQDARAGWMRCNDEWARVVGQVNQQWKEAIHGRN